MSSSVRALAVIGFLAVMGCSNAAQPSANSVAAPVNGALSETEFDVSAIGAEDSSVITAEASTFSAFESVATTSEFVPACMAAFERLNPTKEFCQCVSNAMKNELTDKQVETVVGILNKDAIKVRRLTKEIGAEKRREASQHMLKKSKQCGRVSYE